MRPCLIVFPSMLGRTVLMERSRKHFYATGRPGLGHGWSCTRRREKQWRTDWWFEPRRKKVTAWSRKENGE